MKVNCHYTHLVPTSTIKPNPKNPNKHTEERKACKNNRALWF